jgi:hypothetical protein
VKNPFKPQSQKLGTARIGPAEARDIGTDALLYLVREPEQLTRFLELSGLSPSDLRARANDPELLVFVLEHILSDESLLLAFSANAGHAPEKVAAAAHILSGPPPQSSL